MLSCAGKKNVFLHSTFAWSAVYIQLDKIATNINGLGTDSHPTVTKVAVEYILENAIIVSGKTCILGSKHIPSQMSTSTHTHTHTHTHTKQDYPRKLFPSKYEHARVVSSSVSPFGQIEKKNFPRNRHDALHYRVFSRRMNHDLTF